MNGYINLNLNGDVIGLKFALPAITMFAEAMEKKGQFYYTVGDQPTMTIEGLAKFIECGYKNNCLIKEVDPDFKYEHFYNWVENAVDDKEKMKEVTAILECYAETVYAKMVQVEAEKINKTMEEKKNSIGTILSESSNTNAATGDVK